MAKKIILIVLGAIFILCGLGAAIPATFLIGLGGNDGGITSGYETLGSSTPALVSETEHVSSGGNVPTSGLGATTITLKARNADEPIFLGVARANDVERFLDGVAYDEVRDLDIRPLRVTTTRHDGASSAPPPEDEDFWLASATGDSPTLEWLVEESGTYRLVMMNADGSAGPSAELQLGVEIEGLRGLGIGAIVAGALSFLIGLALLIWGIRTRVPPRPAAATGYPGGTPSGYPPPQYPSTPPPPQYPGPPPPGPPPSP
jgi:hypothetical protein